jgi:hypothetical protein
MGMGVQFQRHLGEEAAGGRVLFPHYKKKKEEEGGIPLRGNSMVSTCLCSMAKEKGHFVIFGAK